MKTKIQTKFLLLFLSMSLILSPACNTSRAVKGGAIGAAAGGVAGGVIGDRAGNTAAGVIIGAAVGGAAGVLIGRYMDKQAEEIRNDLKGAKVERVGEGILITFDSGLLFDVGSYQLRPQTRENLVKLAETLQKYEDTEVLVEGHTDDRGTEEYNMTLSENRAKSVYNQLVRQGVSSTRVTVLGYGESQPIETNNTAEGRQQNRRVEIAIFANKKLKKAAKRGDLPIE